MSYQPPLIGSKQLLNFHATSWPGHRRLDRDRGLAFVLGAALLEWRRAPGHRAGSRRRCPGAIG